MMIRKAERWVFHAPLFDRVGRYIPRKILAFAALNFLIILAGCASIDDGDTESPIPEVKSIPDLKGPVAERLIGQTIVLEGFFVKDPLPMLVTDLDLMMVNKPIPDDQYIVLSGDLVDDMDPSELGGARLTVRGSLTNKPDDDDQEPWKLDLEAYDFIDRSVTYDPKFIELLIDPSQVKPDRFAVLFSGGIKPAHNHKRYWNDLKFMYSTLINKYGFDKKHIAVLYAGGQAQDKQMPVDYAANGKNLDTVFRLLRDVSSSKDLVVLFTSNHGGGFDKSEPSKPHLYGGALDVNGDEGAESLIEKNYNIDFNMDGDKFDQVAWDETLYGWGDDILDDTFASLFTDLKYKHLIGIFEQCFSGGMIPDVSASSSNRILMSAASQYESSYVLSSNQNYDAFSYHITSALNGAEPGGKKVDADGDKDGKISIMEAFNYAQTADLESETPQYDDNGDGATHSGKMPAGNDGKLGAAVSLK